MRRILIVLVSILIGSSVSATVAQTEETALDAPKRPGDPCAQSETRQDAAECYLDFLTQERGQAGGSAGGGGQGTQSSKRYVPYTRIITGPDGKPCASTGWREVNDPIIGDDLFRLPDQESNNILADYAPCPQDPNQPAEEPSVVAARYWEQIPLPKPNPHIAPGWAITGKLSYLETNGQLHYEYRNSTLGGPLEIAATGAYYVDWGDGESTGPHTREGKPWPDGEITHDYVWAKAYDIVVTERWTATWSLGGRSGVLRELRTTGRIDDFPARQIQAVIRS